VGRQIVTAVPLPISLSMRMVPKLARMIRWQSESPSQSDATADESAINKWWGANPEANIGVACGKESNLTVLDVDGEPGRDRLHELEREHGALPECPIVITGSGGEHRYFQYEPGLNNAVRFDRGLDVRTQGGLVIGAGSANAYGEYLFDAAATLKDVEPPKMPSWLIECIKAGQGGHANGNGKANGAGNADDGADIPTGRRDDTIFKLACKLRWAGLSHEEVLSRMHKVNAERCKPPLTDRHVVAKVAQAFKYQNENEYQNEKAAPADATSASEFGVLFSEIEEEPVRYVFDGYLAQGHIHELLGDPEVSKTTVLIDWCARVTTGRGFPDSDKPLLPQSFVMILSGEDSAKSTIKLRLRAAGADMSKIRNLPVRFNKPDEEGEISEGVLTIPDDLPMIEEQIVRDGTKVLVVDPVEEFFPERSNSHNNASTRRVLGALSAMAERTGCAIISIRHFNKMGAVDKALYRGGGSIAFAAAARISMAIGRDPTEHGMRDDDPQRRHVLAIVKCNLAPRQPSRAFRKVVDPETISEEWPHGIVHVEWMAGTVAVTADDLLRPQHKQRNPKALEEAKAFLRDALRGGDAKLSEPIEKKAEALGISKSTLWRARDQLKVIAGHANGSFGGPWTMRIPVNDDGEPDGDDEGFDD
jgi:RecA-family ATPase